MPYVDGQETEKLEVIMEMHDEKEDGMEKETTVKKAPSPSVVVQTRKSTKPRKRKPAKDKTKTRTVAKPKKPAKPIKKATAVRKKPTTVKPSIVVTRRATRRPVATTRRTTPRTTTTTTTTPAPVSGVFARIGNFMGTVRSAISTGASIFTRPYWIRIG